MNNACFNKTQQQGQISASNETSTSSRVTLDKYIFKVKHSWWDISDPRSYEYFWTSSWNETWKKNSDLYRIWTHDLCNTSAVLYQLSKQANWELVIMLDPNKPSKWRIITGNIWKSHVCTVLKKWDLSDLAAMNSTELVVEMRPGFKSHMGLNFFFRSHFNN